MRRTLLERSTTAVRPRSERREGEQVERRELTELLLHHHPECEAWPLLVAAAHASTGPDAAAYVDAYRACGRHSTVLHEPKRRSRGGDYLNPLHCMATCVGCNGWVEQNDRLAEAAGLLIPSWEAGDWRKAMAKKVTRTVKARKPAGARKGVAAQLTPTDRRRAKPTAHRARAKATPECDPACPITRMVGGVCMICGKHG